MQSRGSGRREGIEGKHYYELIASEMIRKLRGQRSQAAFSRRLGYKSNMVNRWESCDAFPSASTFLRIVGVVRRAKTASPILCFFPRPPGELEGIKLDSPDAVALFLRLLRGKTPILTIAAESGYNRYSVSRWLEGSIEVRLPQFLHLIDVLSRRLIDFIECCTDPLHIPSVTRAYQQLKLARMAAYEQPWSHAVLRGLELVGASECDDQVAWLTERLGASRAEILSALNLLVATGQAKRSGKRWAVERVVAVNTAHDRQRALALKVSWTEVALERMRRTAPGSFGYSVFAISKQDIRRLREVHLEYVRAMQSIIAASQSGECVGLYCAQLLDLGQHGNALADRGP